MTKLFEPVTSDGITFFPIGYITREDLQDTNGFDSSTFSDDEMLELAKDFGRALQESASYKDILDICLEYLD